jgi:hypothetical protein
MSNSEPDWALAVDCPLLFFELTENATRGELRRKYAAIIRRFKPETHSEQFMLIRAAYEQLDSIFQRRDSEDSQSASKTLDLFTQPQPLRRNSETHDHEGSHAESKSRGKTTPKPIGTVSTNDLRSMILDEAKGVAHDFFYSLAWDVLTEYIRRASFEQLASLLKDVGVFVDDSTYDNPPENRAKFYLSIMPYLTFKCPPDWLEEELRFLETNADLLPPDNRVDLLLYLFEYRRKVVIESELNDEQDPALARLRLELGNRIRSVFDDPHLFSFERLLGGHLEMIVPDGIYDQIAGNRMENQLYGDLKLWIKLLEIGAFQTQDGAHQMSENPSQEMKAQFVARVRNKWRSSKESRQIQSKVCRYRSSRSGVIFAICLMFAGIACFLSLLIAAVINVPIEIILKPLVGEVVTESVMLVIGAGIVTVATIGTFIYAWHSSQMTIAADGYYWIRAIIVDNWKSVTFLFDSVVFPEFIESTRNHQLGNLELNDVFFCHADTTADAWQITPEAVREFGQYILKNPIARCRLLGTDLYKSSRAFAAHAR